MFYDTLEYGFISSGSQYFYDSVKEYFGEVKRFRICEIKTKQGKTYKVQPILEETSEEKQETENEKEGSYEMITVETILQNPRAIIGIVGLVVLMLVLFIWDKKENKKKFRHREEYGSARWGKHADIEPFEDPVFANNVILSQTERISMSSRPKLPKWYMTEGEADSFFLLPLFRWNTDSLFPLITQKR